MKKQNEADKLKSILVIVIGFLTLYLLSKKISLFYIGFGVGLASLLSATLRGWILFVWDKIAQVLGWINTRIILSVVFYCFLFPIAMVTRMFNKKMLQLKKEDTTTFIERNHQYTKEDLENTW